MQGKIQNCKSAFVVDENGNDIKISDRDELLGAYRPLRMNFSFKANNALCNLPYEGSPTCNLMINISTFPYGNELRIYPPDGYLFEYNEKGQIITQSGADISITPSGMYLTGVGYYVFRDVPIEKIQ